MREHARRLAAAIANARAFADRIRKNDSDAAWHYGHELKIADLCAVIAAAELALQLEEKSDDVSYRD